MSIDAAIAMRGTFAQDSPALPAFFDALVDLLTGSPPHPAAWRAPSSAGREGSARRGSELRPRAARTVVSAAVATHARK